MRLSRLESGRNPARKSISGPGALSHNIEWIVAGLCPIFNIDFHGASRGRHPPSREGLGGGSPPRIRRHTRAKASDTEVGEQSRSGRQGRAPRKAQPSRLYRTRRYRMEVGPQVPDRCGPTQNRRACLCRHRAKGQVDRLGFRLGN